ncbi:hypothetical protein MHB79_15085 [Bacillus sp. FSL M7-0558]|uniref:hypothetical protein n=1 Tax=Bacillus sp. FSL M7-0558 TaxID=2921533 RepID=UPI0030F585C0
MNYLLLPTAAPNEEELADILEVIEDTSHAFNLDMDKVLRVKADKLEKTGGFYEGIILEKVNRVRVVLVEK